MAKTITLQLSFPHANRNSDRHADQRYRVERITDSTEHLPGDYLLKPQVDELCAAKSWKVTIVPARGDV